MGDKIQSKHIAYEAKVNVISGSDDIHLFPNLPNGNVESAEIAIEVANKIKYPVMVKGELKVSKTLLKLQKEVVVKE
jgi:biotin carboxylase